MKLLKTVSCMHIVAFEQNTSTQVQCEQNVAAAYKNRDPPGAMLKLGLKNLLCSH